MFVCCLLDGICLMEHSHLLQKKQLLASFMFNATTGAKMLCFGPQVVALIIFFISRFLHMEPIYEMKGNVIVSLINERCK